MRVLLLFSFVFVFCFSSSYSSVCDITKYGAVGNGYVVNTKIIQSLLNNDNCSEILVPSGNFKTGPLNITRNNVVLNVMGRFRFLRTLVHFL